MKITLDVCIQIVLKHISTFHTNHKQNLNDTCLNFNSYDRKIYLKEKKDLLWRWH